MAISFSRPDPSSPAAVSTANFSTGRRGYEPEEVREFLRMVAAELARLQEREKFLERELRMAQRSAPNPAVLDEEVVTRMLGEEAARILSTAREAASQIKVRAEEGASRVLREATDEAQRLREEAEIESARRRQDAASDAESELQMAKQQGREMVNEARAYRERVLGELARRRELARQQIEQLVHGRDRLLNAFERARIAAVDVMAEMTPLGEPNEYVNLSPTTGPVPLMVPNEMRRRLDAAPVQAVVEEVVEEVVADDAPYDVAAEVEAVEVEAVEEIDLVEVVVDEVADTVVFLTVAADEHDADDHDADEHDADEHDADEPLAAVVALFADDGDARDEVDADVEQDDEDDDDEQKPSVDDLFAKLRAARADSVVQRAMAEPTAEPVAPDEAVTEPDGQPVVDAAAEPEPVPDELSVFAASPTAPTIETEADDTPFGRRDAELTPLIVASARKLKRVLADEQNDVLHILRRTEPVLTLETLLPKPAEHLQRYSKAIEGDLRSAALAGAASVDDGDKGDHLHEINRGRALQPAFDALASSIVMPLRDRVKRAVTAAGGDNGDLADTVRALYREWKTQRIDEHLDDVARMAFGRGALVALSPGTPVCWSVDPNGPDCPDAEDNALAGVIGAGEAFPTDHTCAPAHEGCRCMLQRVPR